MISCNVSSFTSTSRMFWSRLKDPGKEHQSDHCKPYPAAHPFSRFFARSIIRCNLSNCLEMEASYDVLRPGISSRASWKNLKMKIDVSRDMFLHFRIIPIIADFPEIDARTSRKYLLLILCYNELLSNIKLISFFRVPESAL